jgi:hypothetical protein
MPKVDARNRPIDGDSPWKREIFRAAKFPFKIKSNAHLTARPAEFFRAKDFCARKSIHYSAGASRRVKSAIGGSE